MHKFVCLFFGIICLASCDKSRLFDRYKAIDNTGWHKDSIVSFELPVMDSLQQYELFFNVRNTNDYKYSNLFLISTMDFPNGKKQVDTLEYLMAKPDGTWLGEGFSSLKENKLWYKEHFNFKENGIYKISIQQAMRANGTVDGVLYLKGISDIGFRVEASETH